MKLAMLLFLLAIPVSAIPFLEVSFSQDPDRWDVFLSMTARDIPPAAIRQYFWFDGQNAGGSFGTWDAATNGDLHSDYRYNPVDPLVSHLPFWFFPGEHTTAFTYQLDGQGYVIWGDTYTVIQPSFIHVPDNDVGALLMALAICSLAAAKHYRRR